MSKRISYAFLFLLMGINAIVAQNQKIYVTRVNQLDNSVEFSYLKTEPGNYFIEFELEKAENVADISPFKKAYNLSMNFDSGLLFTLHPIDPKKDILCSYSYSYKRGFISPEIDNSFVYILPLKENKRINIKQTTRYNVDAEIWKNYLIYSKIKDTICGMRKGIVSEIRKTTYKDKRSTTLRTEIIVDHADGTFASYIGLDEKALLVKLNDTIYPGTLLGVMDDVVDSEQNHIFKFNIYFFSNEEIEDLEGKKIKVIGRSVKPKFLTTDGIQNLKNDEYYTVKYSDEVLSKEMTIEEKKKRNMFF